MSMYEAARKAYRIETLVRLHVHFPKEQTLALKLARKYGIYNKVRFRLKEIEKWNQNIKKYLEHNKKQHEHQTN